MLIRHAEPEASPSLDPAQWPLSSAGRRGARQLRRGVLLDGARWVSSEERKAVQTLQCLSPQRQGTIIEDGRFNEVRREEPFDGDFRSRRLAWVEGKLDGRHARWETRHEATSRFDAAVRTYARSGERLVIASHGMIMTAWLVSQGLVGAGEDAGRFWRSLRFPDLIDVDLG